MSDTTLLFLNHSSIIVRYKEEYILCDPWFEKPAFGSWLPTFGMFVHPMYIASLEDKLKILISHGHDDHCDDHLLNLFSKDTVIITADYNSPSVTKRLEKIGFENFVLAVEDGVKTGSFFIRGVIDEDISPDDAFYLIRTPDALIIHMNDNWFALDKGKIQMITSEVEKVGRSNTIFLSQTNSASGYPLNYKNYTEKEKRHLLKNKVEKMISTGLQNALSVGAPYFHTYAGYATVYVKNRPEYIENSLFPTPKMIKTEFANIIPDEVEILDIYPGDTFDFKSVRKSFFQHSYSDEQIKAYSNKYWQTYEKIEECDTFDDYSFSIDSIETNLIFFLKEFNKFVIHKVSDDNLYPTVLGKKLGVVVDEIELRIGVEFGQGIIRKGIFNKTVFTSPAIIAKVIEGKILFENLYTGYNAEFERLPEKEYNRDIIMYLVMFSYVYKNRIAPKLKVQS